MKEVNWHHKRHGSHFGESPSTPEVADHHHDSTSSSSEKQLLRVTVQRATDLIDVEGGPKFINGVSDPFCEMFIGGLTNKFYQTEPVNNNLNPVWNDSTVLTLTNTQDRILIFQIWDKNKSRLNKLMGTCGLTLGALHLTRQVPLDLSLNIFHKKNGQEKHGGTLHVQLEALNFDLVASGESTDGGDGSGASAINRHYQVDMSLFDDDLGKSRSLKSILRNEITEEEDRRLDKLFGWDMVDDVYNQFETGDILLHSGVGTFSMFIMLGLKCMWSHVSILIKDPTPAMKKAFNVPEDSEGRVFVLEADSELIDRSKKQGGVQLVELKYWMEEYFKESGPTDFCAYRRLLLPDALGSERANMTSLLEPFITGLTEVKYEQHKIDLVKCIFKTNKKSDTSSLFCSEIVAQTLLHLGLLPQTTITSNYSPKDFSSLSVNLSHVLLRGASYTKERRIRFVPPTGEVEQ